MRNARESAQLREHAVALRRAGKSVRQIKQILGPVGNRTLHDALQGEPPPAWARRPNAKDDLRAKARELRRQGLDYEEIVGRLGVSKSSVSLWVRDLPRPPRAAAEECAERTSERMRAYWTAERPVRAARRAAASAAAAATIGDLTSREILIACPLPLDLSHGQAIDLGGSVAAARIFRVCGGRLPSDLSYLIAGGWP